MEKNIHEDHENCRSFSFTTSRMSPLSFDTPSLLNLRAFELKYCKSKKLGLFHAASLFFVLPAAILRSVSLHRCHMTTVPFSKSTQILQLSEYVNGPNFDPFGLTPTYKAVLHKIPYSIPQLFQNSLYYLRK